MSRLPRVASPVHPIFVHFTVALTSASLLFDVAGTLLGDASLSAAGWWCLAGSVVATVGTIASGVISRVRLPMEEGESRRFLRAHMALGPALFGLLVALCSWRLALWRDAEPAPWRYLAAAAGVVIVTAAQGFIGGELVYRWGAEVQGSYRRLPSERRAEGRTPDTPTTSRDAAAHRPRTA